MIKEIIHEVVKLLPWVSIEEQAKRLKICATCPLRVTTVDVGWTCGKYFAKWRKGKRVCGCILKEKTKLKGFNCPQKKW
jgi:hypothetical protein